MPNGPAQGGRAQEVARSRRMRGLRAKVRDYYSGTIERHGPTPLGVDWPNAASQYLRFVQLLKVCDFREALQPERLRLRLRRAAGISGNASCRSRDRLSRHRHLGIDDFAAARERWASKQPCEICRGPAVRPHGRLLDRQRHIQRPARPSPRPIGKRYVEIDAMRICRPAAGSASPSISCCRTMTSRPRMNSIAARRHAGSPSAGRNSDCSVRVLRGYGLREFTLLIRRKPQTAAPRQAGSRKAARRSPR